MRDVVRYAFICVTVIAGIFEFIYFGTLVCATATEIVRLLGFDIIFLFFLLLVISGSRGSEYAQKNIRHLFHAQGKPQEKRLGRFIRFKIPSQC